MSDDRPPRPNPLDVEQTTVPEYLRDRPLWLVWKYEWKGDRGDDGEWSKVPKDGAGGGYNINATDPENGVAFETAVETYETGEYDGLGIITDPDSLLVGFDVDDCRDPDKPHGSVPEAVTEILDTLDTYVEISPSGTGYRAFALGAKPEGANREDLPCEPVLDETPHLEVYDGTGGRYLTVTGKHLSGAPESIETRPQEIKDVYGEYIADDERDDDTPALDDFDGDDVPALDLTDEELLEKARSASNGEKFKRLENGYDGFHGGDTSKADKAFCQMLAFWTGGDRDRMDRLFRASGRMRGKWTDVHSSDGSTYGEMTIDAALKDQSEFYDPTEAGGGKVPDPSELDWEELGRAEAILQSETAPTDPAGELEHKNGVYGYSWVEHGKNGDVVDSGFDTIANFTLETLAILDTYEGDLLYVRVRPDHPREEPYEVKVKPTVFNDVGTFREEVVTGRTTYFDPGKYPTHKALRELRKTVGSQNAPMHTGTEYVGLHGSDYDEWVTPAGTLTADGWVDDPEYKYYEKGGADDMDSSIQEKWDLEPERNSDYDPEEVREIVERVGWLRKPERGLPVLGWFYAAPLKPLVHDLEREFNLLQVTGGTGTGKTSTLQAFYQLFGADPAPFGCGDKGFTIEKKFASSCGLPIWLDEYKPTDLPAGKLDWLHRRLREVTREQSFSKGLPSLGEVTFQMRAPVVFSGEQTVEEAAVRRRTVMTNFSKESTAGRYQRAYCELTGGTYSENGEERTPAGYDLEDHALAYYQWVLSRSAGELEATWRRAREQADEMIGKVGAAGLDNTESQGLQTIVFGFDLYRQFAESVDADLSALPTVEDLEDAIAHVTENIGPGGRRREHIDEFTELISQAATEGYLEAGTHFRVVESRKFGTETLAFHMPSTFPAVKKYVREYNVEGDYTILGKSDYLDNFRDKIEQGESYALATNQKVNGLENGNRAVYLDLDRAAELVDGFSRSAFVDEETDETESESSPDSPTVTPIENLDPSQRYATITVEVARWEQTSEQVVDAGGPAESGTIRDITGPADLVDFFGASHTGACLREGGTFRITNVRVGRYKGALQLEIVKNLTEVEKIQAGVEYAPDDDPDGEMSEQPTDQTALDTAATDGGTATADETGENGARADADETPPEIPSGPPSDATGTRANAHRLVTVLKETGPLPKGSLVAKATNRYDALDVDSAKAALNYATGSERTWIDDSQEELRAV